VRILFISPLTGTARCSNPDIQKPAVFRVRQKENVFCSNSVEDITKEIASGILATCPAHRNFYLYLGIQTILVSSSITRVITSRRLRSVAYVTRITHEKIIYKILVGEKLKRRKQLNTRG
jgi:hypothetical protein